MANKVFIWAVTFRNTKYDYYTIEYVRAQQCLCDQNHNLIFVSNGIFFKIFFTNEWTRVSSNSIAAKLQKIRVKWAKIETEDGTVKKVRTIVSENSNK